MSKSRSRALQALLLALILVSPSLASARGAGRTQQPDPISTYIIILTGGQMDEIPPSRGPSGRSGVGFLTFDERTKILCYSITHTPIPGETSAHFHGPAPPGVGTEQHEWPDETTSLPAGSPKDGCTDPLPPESERALKEGLWFLEIHSADYPLGELRGQVLPMGVKYGPGSGSSAGDERR